jgi:hypothetical protein
MQNIMQSYFSNYGNTDAVVSVSGWDVLVEGFMQLAQQVGMPARLGIDIYGDQTITDPTQKLANFTSSYNAVVAVLQKYGVGNVTYLQETYFNSTEVSSTISKAFISTGFLPLFIMQWPVPFNQNGQAPLQVSDMSAYSYYLMPQGFFQPSGSQSIYYSNGIGQACPYGNWNQFLAAGGDANMANVMPVAELPPAFMNQPVCQ